MVRPGRTSRAQPAQTLRCATCGKTTRARNAFFLQGWYTGPGGAKYCSSACTAAAPKPKGHGRAVFLKLAAPEGWTSKDVDRWRQYATKVFAEFAAKTLLEEEGRAAAVSAESPGGEARNFRITDYDAVLACWKGSEGTVVGDADNRPAIARYLRRNPGTSLVWEADGHVVGAILGGHDGRRGLLHHLAVAPERRRGGTGRALVEHALAALETGHREDPPDGPALEHGGEEVLEEPGLGRANGRDADVAHRQAQGVVQPDAPLQAPGRQLEAGRARASLMPVRPLANATRSA